MQMLGTHAVERAIVSPFQQAPKRFNALCMDGTPDVLHDRVLDSLVIGEVRVGRGLVRVNSGSFLHIVPHKTLQSFSRSVVNNLGLDLVGVPVFDPNHGGFANGTPTL